ncbi:MAG: tRNA (adenosine(37)-N6)-threonylcarbamoyltransferase complex transferase subunit TsaD [Flavobacteriales bacterium]
MELNNRLILGIESSCDDTAVAITRGFKVCASVINSQEDHVALGGVVPEIASRSHIASIIPTLQQALKEAKVALSDLNGIAFTQGPGLMGSLVVGTSFAKGLSLAINKPLLAVNHLHAHILSHFIEEEGMSNPTFPYLCLTVSGGHTQIVRVISAVDMEILGKTIDDAAGEAYDKAGKMLGLPYPAGPVIDQLAEKGNPNRFTFSIPRIAALDFSFSGLKTSILYFLKKAQAEHPSFIEENIHDLCASIQGAINKALLDKLKLAQKETGITCVAVSGGVSANHGLRMKLEEWQREEPNLTILVTHKKYCTDNAAMIAVTGNFLFESGIFSTQAVAANARLPF